MPRNLRLSLFVLAGFALSGCANATYLSYDIPDPKRAEIVVKTLVKGLAHVQERCNVKVVTRDWIGTGPVVMVNGGDPEEIDVPVKWFEANHETTRPDPGRVQIKFMYGSADLYRGQTAQGVLEPANWDPVKLARTPPPQDTPPVREPTPRDPVTHVQEPLKPKSFSDNPARPESVLIDRSKKTGEIETHVSRSSGPQYGKLSRGSGAFVLEVHVASDEPKGGAPTWFSIELLNDDGSSQDPPKQELGFVDPGGEASMTINWEVTASTRLIKIHSGSEAGDTLRISIKGS